MPEFKFDGLSLQFTVTGWQTVPPAVKAGDSLELQRLSAGCGSWEVRLEPGDRRWKESIRTNSQESFPFPSVSEISSMAYRLAAPCLPDTVAGECLCPNGPSHVPGHLPWRHSLGLLIEVPVDGLLELGGLVCVRGKPPVTAETGDASDLPAHLTPAMTSGLPAHL